MKVSKLLSIDHDLAVLLSRENNASGLVNELLKQYYQEKVEDLEKKNTPTEAGEQADQDKNEGNQAKDAGKSKE